MWWFISKTCSFNRQRHHLQENDSLYWLFQVQSACKYCTFDLSLQFNIFLMSSHSFAFATSFSCSTHLLDVSAGTAAPLFFLTISHSTNDDKRFASDRKSFHTNTPLFRPEPRSLRFWANQERKKEKTKAHTLTPLICFYTISFDLGDFGWIWFEQPCVWQLLTFSSVNFAASNVYIAEGKQLSKRQPKSKSKCY